MAKRPQESSSGLEHELARKDALPARKVGKVWRLYKSDLVAWLRGKEPTGEEGQ